METRIFCEEHGEELNIENVTSRGNDVYIFVAPCPMCATKQSAHMGLANRRVPESDCDHRTPGVMCDFCNPPSE